MIDRKKFQQAILIVLGLLLFARANAAERCDAYKKPVDDKIVLERFERLEALLPPENTAWHIFSFPFPFPPTQLPLQPVVSRYQLGTECVDGGSTVGQIYKDKNGNEVKLGFIPMLFADRWGNTPTYDPHSQKNAVIAGKPGDLIHSEDSPVKFREYVETVGDQKALLTEMDYTIAGKKHSALYIYIFFDRVEVDIELYDLNNDKERLKTFASTLNFDAFRNLP